MKDIGTDETRVGTACTFTGRGAWLGSARRVRTLVVASLAALGLLAIGAGYFLARAPGPLVLPPGPRDGAALPADLPRWSLPSLPPVSPPPAAQPKNDAAGANRSTGARHDAAARDRRVAGAPGPERPAAGSRDAAARSAVSAAVPARFRFHVQAGSFVERDNAVSLLTRLRERGYAAKLIDGALYRVWVGGYFDRATAERLASSLRADGFDSTLTPR